MTGRSDRRARARGAIAAAIVICSAILAACTPAAGGSAGAVTVTSTEYVAAASQHGSEAAAPQQVSSPRATSMTTSAAKPPGDSTEPRAARATPSTGAPDDTGTFTLALAGDFNFSGRTAALLAADPATALKEAAGELSGADLTMVNLETAITTRGTPAPKEFHFRAPASALDALAAGGVDVATMANNHAVDYGDQGLADTLAAVAHSPIPVLGIGANADVAYAPLIRTVHGVRVAILAASQVHDWTIATHSATDTKPGIASAFSPRLVAAVKAAKARADVVVVYLHWGIEFDTCPSGEQRTLAAALAAAGATAIVGTHAHVLQGAGWRSDGSYVAYGLGNYYWWRSFGNKQDDNGVLTLTFDRKSVISATFLPTHLDSRGVPQVATGAAKARIDAQWDRDRVCADLAASPPQP